MKNTIGQSICITLFGESHGREIGCVIDGIAPGIAVDENYIASRLSLRRPSGLISTQRHEPDEFRIVSGVRDGRACGTPICILIPNTDTRSSDYESGDYLARPGHADYPAREKYHGYEDIRGGGHFSGRITAPLVVAGAILSQALEERGIYIGTHIERLGGVSDRRFSGNTAQITEQIKAIADMDFAVFDPERGKLMREAVMAARADGDSVGGVLETAVTGMPAGVGEPWFDTVEGLLSHALFSIPAVKGVEFGDGFALADMRGSQSNDPLRACGGRAVAQSNRCGGIGGGITMGSPMIFRCAVKPTPSISREQQTVNLGTGENATLTIKGRHDPAIVHRARIVVDSMTAITLADMLAVRYGTDWLAGR